MKPHMALRRGCCPHRRYGSALIYGAPTASQERSCALLGKARSPRSCSGVARAMALAVPLVTGGVHAASAASQSEASQWAHL